MSQVQPNVSPASAAAIRAPFWCHTCLTVTVTPTGEPVRHMNVLTEPSQHQIMKPVVDDITDPHRLERVADSAGEEEDSQPNQRAAGTGIYGVPLASAPSLRSLLQHLAKVAAVLAERFEVTDKELCNGSFAPTPGLRVAGCTWT